MEIQREIETRFKKAIKANKIVLLIGARRTGKTWFLKKMLPKLGMPFLLLNDEDQSAQNLLKEKTISNYKEILGKSKILVIDEAQKIPEIGWVLKLMVDEIEGLHIIATGSSVFDLTQRMGEPLTGRKTDIHLFSLS
jgi:predicted AAA+ superfamily ATPase